MLMVRSTKDNGKRMKKRDTGCCVGEMGRNMKVNGWPTRNTGRESCTSMMAATIRVNLTQMRSTVQANTCILIRDSM